MYNDTLLASTSQRLHIANINWFSRNFETLVENETVAVFTENALVWTAASQPYKLSGMGPVAQANPPLPLPGPWWNPIRSGMCPEATS